MRDVITVIHRVTARVVGADIVEYNPRRDIHGMTAMVAAKLIMEIGAVMLGDDSGQSAGEMAAGSSL